MKNIIERELKKNKEYKQNAKEELYLKIIIFTCLIVWCLSPIIIGLYLSTTFFVLYSVFWIITTLWIIFRSTPCGCCGCYPRF